MFDKTESNPLGKAKGVKTSKQYCAADLGLAFAAGIIIQFLLGI